jgi:hypothetical protein
MWEPEFPYLVERGLSLTTTPLPAPSLLLAPSSSVGHANTAKGIRMASRWCLELKRPLRRDHDRYRDGTTIGELGRLGEAKEWTMSGIIVSKSHLY